MIEGLFVIRVPFTAGKFPYLRRWVCLIGGFYAAITAMNQDEKALGDWLDTSWMNTGHEVRNFNTGDIWFDVCCGA